MSNITFKKYLKENTSQFIDNADDIKRWLDEVGICDDYDIDADTLIVNVDGNMLSGNTPIEYFRCQFGTVGGDVDLTDQQLTSLVGFPKHVKGYVDCDNMRELKSFKGLENTTIDGYLSLQFCGNTNYEFLPTVTGKSGKANIYLYNETVSSLAGIHKYGKMNGSTITLNANKIKSNVLGLALLGCSVIGDGTSVSSWPKWLKIVNELLATNINNTRRQDLVFELQTRLLDAGLDDYAKL